MPIKSDTLKDYYRVLEIPPDATHDQIKAAYRAKAFACHPDRGGSPHRMRLVNEAWSTLGEPDSRREYDSLLNAKRAEIARNAPSPKPAAPRQPANPTFITTLGSLAMFFAFHIGKGIRSLIRLFKRLFHR